jgi:hypothetical protein
MRSKDLKAVNPKVLVIGEDSNLQWSDNVPNYVMFADYYFREFPQEGGERSRNVEARNLFEHIMGFTGNRVKSTEIYFTNLCNDFIAAKPPKGKRQLIPEHLAQKGVDHIQWILEQNPSIQLVFVMSLQSNYWLQKLGFYNNDDAFIAGAQPRRIGLESSAPYYQPVDGKAFSLICGKIFDAPKYRVKVIPTLAARDYPMNELNTKRFSEAYERVRNQIELN